MVAAVMIFANFLRPSLRMLRFGGLLILPVMVLPGCVSSNNSELVQSSSSHATQPADANGQISVNPETGTVMAKADSEEDERPTAQAEQISADSGKQQLVQLGDGITISVPSPRIYAVGGVDVATQDEAPDTELPDTELTVAAIPTNSPSNGAANGKVVALTAASATNVVAPEAANRPTLALAPVTDTPAVQSSSASAKAAENQATASLNEPLNKGGFLARFFRRPKVDVGATDDRRNPILASSRSSSYSLKAGLPGVKDNNQLFGTAGKKNSNIRLASVGGLGRLSPLDIKTQHSGVEVKCIRPDVVRLLKIIENKYGRPPVVTSGYRSPSRNRRAGGAKNSMHMYCKAVDIQVKGVSKWKLAKFMRTIPGRGGVGTYCRTKSVHLDVGPKRDWHYSCRRKSKRRRRKA